MDAARKWWDVPYIPVLSLSISLPFFPSREHLDCRSRRIENLRSRQPRDWRGVFLRFFGRRLRFIDLRVLRRCLCLGNFNGGAVPYYGRDFKLRSTRARAIGISSARKLSDKIISVIAMLSPRRRAQRDEWTNGRGSCGGSIPREISLHAERTRAKTLWGKFRNIAARAFGRGARALSHTIEFAALLKRYRREAPLKIFNGSPRHGRLDHYREFPTL